MADYCRYDIHGSVSESGVASVGWRQISLRLASLFHRSPLTVPVAFTWRRWRSIRTQCYHGTSINKFRRFRAAGDTIRLLIIFFSLLIKCFDSKNPNQLIQGSTALQHLLIGFAEADSLRHWAVKEPGFLQSYFWLWFELIRWIQRRINYPSEEMWAACRVASDVIGWRSASLFDISATRHGGKLGFLRKNEAGFRGCN